MTATPAYEISCDCTCTNCPEHECSVGIFGSCGRAHTDYGTATQVRARARSVGWRTNLPGGKDGCPDCNGRART